MMRLLYISGMVFCAVLIGGSAHHLQKLYKDGTLFDPYNNERRATVTLMVASGLGLAAFCIVEVVRIRRRIGRSGDIVIKAETDAAPAEQRSTSIYSAPATVDAWQSPPQRVSERKSSHRQSLPSLLSQERAGLWMSLLRIFSAVLPIVYGFILLYYLIVWLPTGAGAWWLSSLFTVLLLGAVLTAVGILQRKVWGRKIGFAMAVFHLLIFPVGTLAGFIMLIALIGATSEFDVISRRRHRSGRARARHRKAVV